MAKLSHLLTGDDRDPREELVEIFSADSRSASLARARDWAKGIIDGREIVAEDQVRVIGALRKAEPRLGLKSATYLAHAITL